MSFRRALTTIATASSSSTPLPSSAVAAASAAAARTAPQAVKLRRSVESSHLLPPKLEEEFQSLRLQGQFKGDEASGRKAFWDRRNRVRGIRGEETVGQRIYLPNIQIRLVRNHTPPGEAYDANVATFRIPHGMTKTDLRSYLAAVYGMDVTFIRTDNYFAPVKRTQPGGQIRPESGSKKNYKRAIVGLIEPFHYPDDVDELFAQGEKMGLGSKLGDERKEWIETNFQMEAMAEMKKKALMKFHKGYRWRSKTHDNPVSSRVCDDKTSDCDALLMISGQCHAGNHAETKREGGATGGRDTDGITGSIDAIHPHQSCTTF